MAHFWWGIMINSTYHCRILWGKVGRILTLLQLMVQSLMEELERVLPSWQETHMRRSEKQGLRENFTLCNSRKAQMVLMAGVQAARLVISRWEGIPSALLWWWWPWEAQWLPAERQWRRWRKWVESLWNLLGKMSSGERGRGQNIMFEMIKYLFLKNPLGKKLMFCDTGKISFLPSDIVRKRTFIISRLQEQLRNLNIHLV